MQIKKVTYNGTKVCIDYEVPDPEEGGAPDQFSLKCSDAPSSSFKRALQDLAPFVLEACEIKQKGYDQGLEVRGVTYTYADGVVGASMSAVKKLAGNNSPFNLHTPHKLTEPGENGEVAHCLGPQCAAALERLAGEARKYIKGLRSPMPLFEKEQDLAEAEAA